MKPQFNNLDLNAQYRYRSSVQVPSDKFPNLGKTTQNNSIKQSFKSLNSSTFKEINHQKPGLLPRINDGQKQNSHQIRKLLKQNSVPLKVVPLNRNSKTKFGWITQSATGSPHQKDYTHTKQESLHCSVPSGQKSSQTIKNSKFRLSLLNFQQRDNVSQNGQQIKNELSSKLSNFSQKLSNSYENFVWNEETQQMEFMQDQIVSEGFDRQDQKTTKFMEADREIEMKRKEIISTERNKTKKETEEQQIKMSEIQKTKLDQLIQSKSNKEMSNQIQQLQSRGQHKKSNQPSKVFQNQNQPQNDDKPQKDKHKNSLPFNTAQNQNPGSKIQIQLPSQQQIPSKYQNNKEQVSQSIVNTKSTRVKKEHIKQIVIEGLEKSHWLQTIDQLHAEFTKMGYDRAIFEKEIFLHIVSTFNKFYMDREQKMYFLDIIQKLVMVNSGWEKIEDQLKFSGQMGLKLQKLANTIHFKQKECLHNWQFIASDSKQSESQANSKKPHQVIFTQLKFNMDLNQIASMTKVVEKLCVNNMDAFAFVSLYFQISIDNTLQQKTFKETEKQFIQCLQFLKELYPASKASVYPDSRKSKQSKQQVKENNTDVQHSKKSQQSFGIETIKVQHQFDWVEFDKSSQLSNFDQLKEYIKKIAKLAQKDLQIYNELVKYSCIEHGFGFKSGLKIKNDDSQIFSIMRTIEKLLTSSFGKELQKFKHQRMEKADDELKYGSIKNFIQKEQIEVQNDLKSILQKQNKIMFKAKDLVRGKCKFNTIEQIQATIKLLKQNIQKKADQGIKIIELQNRLGNNTKDVVLLIKLPNTIAQLQLALKLDSVLNEFNHKIYELRRSKIYACVSNLFISGKKWAESFFRQQLQLFKEISIANPTENYGEPVCAQDIKKYVFLFQQNYLKANDIKTTTDKLDQYNENRLIEDKITIIEKGIKIGYHSLLDKKKRVNMQKENAVLFYLKNGKVGRAWQIVEQFSEQELDQNPIILRLKGDILREREEKGDERKCIECYERYVSLEMDENGQTIEMANVLLMLAEIKLGNRNFKQAQMYFKRCARIRQKIFKKQSTEYAMVLNRMGHLYRIQGKYEYSMRFYKRALQIIVMKSGKDSIAAAEVYCSLGNACFCCGQITQSHDFYEKSLQIYKKGKGGKSIEVSIIYNNMGNFYKQQLKFSQALDKYQKCLEIKEKLKGQTSLDVAYVYNNIGTLYRKFENFIEAEKFYKMSLMIKKKAKGQLSYHAATSYLDMGKFYTAKSVSKDKDVHDYDTAMMYFKDALKIKRQVFKNEENLQIADVVASIGSLYWTIKSPKALEYYFYSKQIMQKIGAKNSIEYSKILINMGMVYQERAKQHKQKRQQEKAGQNQLEAVKHYDRGAMIEQNIRGETVDLAETNFSLSQLYLQMEMYQRAYDCAEKAFVIWKRVRGDDYKYTKSAFVLRDKIMAMKNLKKK